MKQKIRIKYSEIKKESREELLKMKKVFQLHLMKKENLITHKREKGFDPKQVRKNIARINQRLKELK